MGYELIPGEAGEAYSIYIAPIHSFVLLQIYKIQATRQYKGLSILYRKQLYKFLIKRLIIPEYVVTKLYFSSSTCAAGKQIQHSTGNLCYTLKTPIICTI
ncbi:hypothetical protein PKOR_06200 [Pontibacter korlensis]|uniref:Uncharacterized protein n=1 Tax=Pontibacter korlensis TaxID=400092 RepID=A0A0E3ZFC6_9BACT|nr:hypothetical protein PKOR_06200 [Pontibacter korlensis]